MPVTNNGDIITKVVLERALDKINIEELLVESLPQIKKQIQKDLIDAIKNYDFADLVYDAINESDLIRKAVVSTVVKALKVA
jgi:hypothetical protein